MTRPCGDSQLPGLKEYRSLAQVREEAGQRFDRGQRPLMFDRLDWLDGMARHCLPDTQPLIIQASEGNTEAWLFLAQTRPGHAVAMANFYSFSWRPLFVGDPDPASRKRLLAAAARHLARRNALIGLYPVLDDDGDLALLTTAFRDAGWLAIARPMGNNHLLRLDGRDFATYWAARPGPLRSTVQRKGRASPYAITIHDRLTDALWRDYVDVYERSWKPQEANFDFLRAIAEQEGEAGALRLGFAREGDTAVAAQYWTVENGTAFIHKLAHDAAHDRGSPGTLLSHAMFRHAIDTDHVALIDYGTGDNPHKTGWMEETRPLYRLDCYNPARPSTWLPAARTTISRLVGPPAKR